MPTDIQHKPAAIALHTLLGAVDWTEAPLDRLRITPSATLVAADFPIADLATAALSALGLSLSALDSVRCGRAQTVSVDRRAASIAMAASDYLRIDGEKAKQWDPITGYYRTADGGWVYLHGNFAHLRDGLLDLFGVPNDRAALASRLAGIGAQEIEDRAAARGLCAVRFRDFAAWQAHPQAVAVRGLPVVWLTRIGDAPPRPLPPNVAAARPLAGLRVLDLTRVIAGPMAGRALAENGATVMRIAGPHLPFIEPLVIDTGFGKRSAHIDLSDPAGSVRLNDLVGEADIFIESYRPGSLAARGFSPEALAARRPGIVTVSVSAFSGTGPWRGRRGYDTLVQAAAGFAMSRDGGVPERMPCQPLDYLSGYLAAFGAVAGLLRRHTEGGSWHVEVSLARTAQWIRDMHAAIGPEPAPPGQNPDIADIPDLLTEMESAFGRLSALRPAMGLSETPPGWDRPPVPLGTDSPDWP